MKYNAEAFDLTNWKLTVDTDAKGGVTGTAQEIANPALKTYSGPAFFVGADGAMVFRCRVDGARTSANTKYPRSETREMIGAEKAAWNPKQYGALSATLKIDEIPMMAGKRGKMVIGQIHGIDNELCRLYWDDGEIYFVNDKTGEEGKTLAEVKHYFKAVIDGKPIPKVAIGQKFGYVISVDPANTDKLRLTVYIAGVAYMSETHINSFWNNDALYFKAGVYLNVNAAQGWSGFGQVSFYGLDVSHVQGKGLAGLTDEVKKLPAAPAPVTPPVVTPPVTPTPTPPVVTPPVTPPVTPAPSAAPLTRKDLAAIYRRFADELEK